MDAVFMPEFRRKERDPIISSEVCVITSSYARNGVKLSILGTQPRKKRKEMQNDKRISETARH